MKQSIKTLFTSFSLPAQQAGLLFLVMLIAVVLLNALEAHAQVPQLFNYQGIARDVKGNPLSNQTMAIKLAILPTSDATVPEYEETQSVKTNEFGLYTLQIGNGTSTTLRTMKDVKWETGNKYIKVGIDPNGGTNFVNAGTNQLLSVPYAIYADKAGIAASGGNDKTRTGAVNSEAGHVAGDAGFLSKFTALNIIGKSLVFDNGSNLGIGTISPIARLHMTSNVAIPQEHIRMENLNPAGAGRFTLYNDVNNAFATFTKYGTTAVGGSPGISALYPFANLLAFGNNETGTAGNGRFLISTEGNTGISLLKGGTAKLKLHIDYATERVGIGGNSVPAAQVHFNNTAATNDTIKFTNNTMGHTATDGLEIRTNGNNGRLINRENAFLLLGTNNTDRIAITGAGNVGIGTIAPAATLDVNGQVRIQGGSPGTGKVLISDSSGLATWQVPTISTVENGLTKKNDTLSLGGRLMKSTTINQDGNVFSITDNDSSGILGVSISQLVFSPFTTLTASPITQTFKSLASNKLHSIDLRVSAFSNTSITLELKNPQGETLATQTQNFATLFDSIKTFTIASQPILLPNEIYTILVTGSAGTSWYFANTNPYADGVASTGVNNDFAFQIRTRVELPVLTAKNERVGIGTFEPTAKLDVNGNIRIQGGNPGLGKILMSDANGIASWQALGGPDSQWAKNGNNIFNNNSGNVGIGTPFPTKKLHVTGDADINGVIVGRGNGANGSSTVLGINALFDNTTGNGNTAIGNNALSNNTSGGQNTAIGNNALSDNTSGSFNIAIGHQALSNSNFGNFNIGIGVASWRNTTMGIHNVGIGDSIIGVNGGNTDKCTFIGFRARTHTFGFTNSTAIGANSTVGCQNCLVLGSIAGENGATNNVDVGIGTSAPAKRLHVVDAGTSGGTPFSAAGLVLENNTSSYLQLLTPDASDNGILFGTASDSRSGGILYNAAGNKGFQFRTNGNSTKMVIDSSGNVGIGTTAPTFQLQLSTNSAAKPTSSSWTISSDARLKTVDGTYTRGLADVLKLNTVKYHYNKGNARNLPTEEQGYGFVAQELQLIYPEAVKENSDGFLSVDFHPVLVSYINAFKDQQVQIDDLKKQNELLMKRLDALEKK